MCIEMIEKNMEIQLKFKETKIDMIRIQNYNKTRTYRNKGERKMKILIGMNSSGSLLMRLNWSNATSNSDNADIYYAFQQLINTRQVIYFKINFQRYNKETQLQFR